MGVLPVSSKAMDHCVELCVKCARACEECLVACLGEHDVKARAKCIKSLVDCAAICFLAIQFMDRDSMHAKALCKLCAEICDECAMQCGMHKDEHCPECARICKECADACRKMA